MLRFPYRQVFGDPKDTEGKQFYALDRFKGDGGAGHLEIHRGDEAGKVT